MSDFLNAVKNRRSIYTISKDSVISEEQIEKIVDEAVLHTPSSFNSQSARIVVLFNEHHDRLWNLTEETLRQVVAADSFAATKQKMDAFRNGYGTVLFFEDQEVVEGLQANFQLYADNFPVWSNQSNGMLQFVIWTALHEAGLGATLQHYNPLIDEGVAAEWNIPQSWKLIAQMPFGKPTAQADEKQFAPIDNRVKVFK